MPAVLQKHLQTSGHGGPGNDGTQVMDSQQSENFDSTGEQGDVDEECVLNNTEIKEETESSINFLNSQNDENGLNQSQHQILNMSVQQHHNTFQHFAQQPNVQASFSDSCNKTNQQIVFLPMSS